MNTQNNCGPKCDCNSGSQKSSFKGDVSSGVVSSLISSALLAVWGIIIGVATGGNK